MKIRSQLKARSVVLLLSASTMYPMAGRIKSAVAYFADKLPNKETIIQKAVNIPWALDRALQSPTAQQVGPVIKDLAKDSYVICAAAGLGTTAYALKNGGPTFNAKFGGTAKWQDTPESQSELPTFELGGLKDANRLKITADAEVETLKKAANQFANELPKKSVKIGDITIRYIPNRKNLNNENNTIEENKKASATPNPEVKVAQAEVVEEPLYDAIAQGNLEKVKEITRTINSVQEMNARIAHNTKTFNFGGESKELTPLGYATELGKIKIISFLYDELKRLI